MDTAVGRIASHGVTDSSAGGAISGCRKCAWPARPSAHASARSPRPVAGARQLVQAAVRAAQPALADIPSRTSSVPRQVDVRAARVTSSPPVNVAVPPCASHSPAPPAGRQIAAHLQQPPPCTSVRSGSRSRRRPPSPACAGPPTLRCCSVLAVTVHRRIALLVTLHVDPDAVGLHRHLHADRARHVQPRPRPPAPAPADTAICPPVATVVEPPANSACPPVTTSMRDVAPVGHRAQVVVCAARLVGRLAIQRLQRRVRCRPDR